MSGRGRSRRVAHTGETGADKNSPGVTGFWRSPLCPPLLFKRKCLRKNCDERSVKAVSKSMPARHGMPRMRRRRQPPPTDPHPAPTRTPQLVDPGSFAFITAHLLGNGGDTTVHQVRMHLHVSTAIQTWILHVSPVRCTPSCIASECCPPLVNSE